MTNPFDTLNALNDAWHEKYGPRGQFYTPQKPPLVFPERLSSYCVDDHHDRCRGVAGVGHEFVCPCRCHGEAA